MATDAQKVAVAQNFLLAAPPGEFNEVVTGTFFLPMKKRERQNRTNCNQLSISFSSQPTTEPLFIT